jgi:hypothetical protein
MLRHAATQRMVLQRLSLVLGAVAARGSVEAAAAFMDSTLALASSSPCGESAWVRVFSPRAFPLQECANASASLASNSRSRRCVTCSGNVPCLVGSLLHRAMWSVHWSWPQCGALTEPCGVLTEPCGVFVGAGRRCR